MNDSPIFITGVYRSGTTLVTRILNNHPELAVTYDSVHFMRFSYGRFDPIEINFADCVYEIHERISRRWNMQFDVASVIAKLQDYTNINYKDVYSEVMHALFSHQSGVKRWGEKTNICWGKIPDFLNMFPQGKVIHVLRDPRDVLNSYKNMTSESGWKYLDAIFASRDSFRKMFDYRKTLAASSYYPLIFEDLLRNPEQITKSLSDFIGISYTQEMLKPELFVDKNGSDWKGNSAFDSVVVDISPHVIGRWRNHLQQFEVFLCELINRDIMLKCGYMCSGILPSEKDYSVLIKALSDEFISSRYQYWVESNEGVEAYPSDPIMASSKIKEKTD